MAKKKGRKTIKGSSMPVPRGKRQSQTTLKIPNADIGAVLQCLAKTGRMTLKVREVGRTRAGSPKMVVNVED